MSPMGQFTERGGAGVLGELEVGKFNPQRGNERLDLALGRSLLTLAVAM